MGHVSKSKFRTRVLQYLRQVEETGQGLVITDRGRPVARITPCRPAPAAKAVGPTRLRGAVTRYEDPFGPVGVEDRKASK
ncbi:MAG: type II toxin-antitoxin system Phd/YefM family antitoxin [Burkholderiales bacterium]